MLLACQRRSKKLNEHSRLSVAPLRDTEISRIRKKVEKLTNEADVTGPEFQIKWALTEQQTNFLKHVAKLRETAAEDGTLVYATDGLWQYISVEKKAVPKFVPIVEQAFHLWEDAENKADSATFNFFFC